MPPLTRWYIKSGLLYLVIALFLALALAWPKAPPLIRAMNPVFFHLFLVGWVTQMIFGVIYWMFPIISRANPRGHTGMGWASYALLNGGLLLRVLAEPLNTLRPGQIWSWLLILSALTQWLAVVLFLLLAWPRVREKYRGG